MEIVSLIPWGFHNLNGTLCELLLFYCQNIFLQLPFLLEGRFCVCVSLFYVTQIFINQDVKGRYVPSTVSVFPLSDF